ncbi:ExbD/TolR family protein [Mucisphaera sp.]|uniref:ExbD/TolR family protein n=1 Tax=Mucisphaera sp. TaxID=2913024 RepID=UPI003D0BC2A5
MSRFKNMKSDEGNYGDIDMSPMIDCVFIMLIFFIVATTFVEVPDVTIDQPIATTQETLEKESIYIALTPEGEVVYAARQIGVTGVQPLVRRMLEDEPERPVIIQTDGNAESGTLIRIIDEAKRAGALKVSLATQINQN